MMDQMMKEPCGDCIDGRCTMNCGPRTPLRRQGIASWDDLEALLGKVRGMIDDADGTRFGQMGKLLDDMATVTDKAIAAAKQLRADDTPPLYRCAACEAESEGDPPDCPRDGVHCNVVEVG